MGRNTKRMEHNFATEATTALVTLLVFSSVFLVLVFLFNGFSPNDLFPFQVMAGF